jgi:transcriptional regulator with XRE-family HTH domain
MNIGANIKAIRKKKGLTQTQLANLMGSSKQMVSVWENSERELTIATLSKIAIALDIDINELLQDSNVKTENNNQNTIIISNPYNTNTKNQKDLWKNADLLKGVGGVPYALNGSMDSIKPEMIKLFSSLNEKGQSKAIEQIEMLAKIPEYQADKTKDSE